MKTRIYTGIGDRGTTRLPGDREVEKYHPRIEALGTVDELNAYLGLALSFIHDQLLNERLTTIQQELLEFGAVLSGSLPSAAFAGHAGRLEEWIDEYEASLPELHAFILPAGETGAAILQVTRTICRRAERRVTALGQDVPGELLIYLNRLSDLLFVLARAVNQSAGVTDTVWKR